MNTTLRCLALFLACAVALAARASDDLKLLTGTWKPAKAEIGGTAIPQPILDTITLKLDGIRYEVLVMTQKGPSPDRGTIGIDPSATPKGMTVTGIEGPNAGKTFPAIYEISGDTLRICYDLSGQKRPPEFATKPGTALYFVTYQRAK